MWANPGFWWAPVLTVLGDVGGQKTLRSYWKNYFEKTDTLVWVVDATDRLRVDDCRQELSGLLLEEVRMTSPPAKSWKRQLNPFHQRLTGASLLVFLNKTDVEHCMSEQEVREVGPSSSFGIRWGLLDLANVLCSVSTWIQSKPISGLSCHAVQWQAQIWMKVWNGWYKMLRTDCSFISELGGNRPVSSLDIHTDTK